jgi:hypothetical protein
MKSQKNLVKPAASISHQRGIREFLVYIIPFALLIFLSLGEHEPAIPGDSSDSGPASPLSSDFWYKHALGSPAAPAKNVTVITVGREMPIGIGASIGAKSDLKDPCKRRVYLAELLKALGAADPKAIVLDLWLDPASCSDDASTDFLLKEVSAISAHTPLVFGLGSYSPGEIRTNFPAEFTSMKNQHPGLEDTQLVLMHTLIPGTPANHISQGIAEVNSDNRKIPLSWPVFSDFESLGNHVEPRRVDSLSIAAVRAFDPGHPVLERVGAQAADGSPIASLQAHPFTNFLKEEDFAVYSALDVICAQATDGPSSQLCEAFPRKARAVDVRGRLLVVGIVGTGSDLHQTIIGRVPGVVLQANYIQSLLDLRVYKPMRPVYQITIGAIWLLVILWISWRCASHTFLGLLFSLLAAAIPAYLIRVLISRFGYYTQLLIPLMIAALVLSVTRQVDRIVTRQEEVP